MGRELKRIGMKTQNRDFSGFIAVTSDGSVTADISPFASSVVQRCLMDLINGLQ
jgi:hypothetical protein